MESLKRMANWLRGNGGGETARQLEALHAELAKITGGDGISTKETISRQEPESISSNLSKLGDYDAGILESSPSASHSDEDFKTPLHDEAADAIRAEQNARPKPRSGTDSARLQGTATSEETEAKRKSLLERLTKNAIAGARREKETRDQLKAQNPGKSVQRERYLRDKDGNIIRDPETGKARRVDHAVIDRENERARTYETTGPEVPKTEQMAKEVRIRKQAGTYIRDHETRKMIPTEGDSEIVRRP